ncbi:MAG: hypothetical protein ACI81R_001670 [Bradymonadia bacterium]|jgi:hypothetical protein
MPTFAVGTPRHPGLEHEIKAAAAAAAVRAIGSLWIRIGDLHVESRE